MRTLQNNFFVRHLDVFVAAVIIQTAVNVFVSEYSRLWNNQFSVLYMTK